MNEADAANGPDVVKAPSGRASGALLLLAWALATSCSSEAPAPVDPEPTPTPDAGGMPGPGPGPSGDAGGTSPDPPPETCESVVEEHPPISTAHTTQCLPVSYDTNPPSGGTHYGVWAAFQNYDYVVPDGYLVHSLEHGAVVFWYDCPGGCPDEVARARDFIDSLPADMACAGTSTPRRVILVPAPELASRWAASSWGFTLTADCFDADALGEFYQAHFGNGPEDFCTPGVVIPENSCP